jgi:hypothetical protein
VVEIASIEEFAGKEACRELEELKSWVEPILPIVLGEWEET